jgi:EAL domain-containing protein (putative c-di-GMP-specific phosphodiesterase class I)
VVNGQFPVNSLKIDQSFVRDQAIGKDAAVIIAEGVETEEQLRFLGEHGCDFVQGYLTGRPAPPDAWRASLAGDATGKPRAA